LSARRRLRLDPSQRLLSALTAVAVVVAAAAATLGGILLRHAANVERQALRTQELASVVVQLQGFSLRLGVEGATPQLKAARAQALDASEAAFDSVRAHDRHEAERLGAVYRAYVDGSTRAFDRAAVTGSASLDGQRRVDQQLSRFQGRGSTSSSVGSRARRASRIRGRGRR
jgi:hypothetical protein